MCKHYKGEYRCRAFELIPRNIFIGTNDHSHPLRGQKNKIVFEPIDPEK
jgi:hypothetical protein